MSSKEDFLDRLKQPKEKFSVLLVDDACRTLKDQITEQIDCYTETQTIDRLDLDCLTRWYGSPDHLLTKYDTLFFDATYEEDGISTIDVLEKLIKSNPAFADVSKVLIGTDVIEFAKVDDFEARYLIERVRKLPHIIYGNQSGTKAENMIRHIQSEGRKKGIEVPIALPQGLCRPELLSKVKPYIFTISKNLMEQYDLGLNLYDDIKDFEPTNETERRMIERAKELSSLLVENSHLIKHTYSGLSATHHRATEDIDEETVSDDEKEHE